MNLINLDTLQPDAEGSLHVAAQAAQTVQRLELTEQQQTIIATGSAMYVHLLERVMRERQQLQLQFTSSAVDGAAVGAATDAATDDEGGQDREQQGRSAGAGADASAAGGPSSSSNSGPSSSSSGSGSGGSMCGGGSDSLGSIHARLEAEQRRMARLQLLMQKEYILRMAGLAWVVGCLSWEQVGESVEQS